MGVQANFSPLFVFFPWAKIAFRYIFAGFLRSLFCSRPLLPFCSRVKNMPSRNKKNYDTETIDVHMHVFFMQTGNSSKTLTNFCVLGFQWALMAGTLLKEKTLICYYFLRIIFGLGNVILRTFLFLSRKKSRFMFQ